MSSQFDDAEDQFADADDSDMEDVKLLYKPAKLYATTTQNAPPRSATTPARPLKPFGARGSTLGAPLESSQKFPQSASWGGGAVLAGHGRASKEHPQPPPPWNKLNAAAPRISTTTKPSAASTLAAAAPKNQPFVPAAAPTAFGRKPSVPVAAPTAVARKPTLPAGAATMKIPKQPKKTKGKSPEMRGIKEAPQKPKKKKKKEKKRSSESDASGKKRKRGRPKLSASSKYPPRPTVAAAAVAAAAVVPQIMKRPEEATVVPDCLIRQQVVRATALVTEEIRSGVWPPLLNNAIQLQQAASAVEQFAMEIILPSLQSASKAPPAFTLPSKQKHQYEPKEHDRHFIATLLLLREVIMLNVERIFGHDANANTEEEQDDDDVKPPGAARMFQRVQKEEESFRAHLLATGLVLASVQRLSEKLVKEITLQMEKYDTGHAAFSSCLEPADGRCVNVLPSKQVLDREEGVACRVSFNCARKQHPLLSNATKQHVMDQDVLQHVVADDGTQELSPLHRFSMAKPNACHVSIVEREPGTT